MENSKVHLQANADIKLKMIFEGVPQWKLAEALGISETTIGRRLRTELSEEDKAKYLKAIEEVAHHE